MMTTSAISAAPTLAGPGHAPRRVPADPLLATQRSFAAAMGRPQVVAGLSDADRARDVAEQLVTQTFIQPLLKQLRESSNAAPPFAPNAAEKQFRALTDAELAQRMVHATRFPLVDRLAHDLLKRGGKDSSGRDAAAEVASLRAPLPSRTTGKD